MGAPRVGIRIAAAGDEAELATVAAATFPLACPPSTAVADVDAFLAANLSEPRFAEYLSDPGRVVLAATADGRIIGYAMLIGPAAGDLTVELSKMYLLPGHHGTGAASALMGAGLDWAAGADAGAVWLGVNQHNHRAQRFYGKHGFAVTGTRSFRLGAAVENDFVMTRPLPRS